MTPWTEEEEEAPAEDGCALISWRRERVCGGCFWRLKALEVHWWERVGVRTRVLFIVVTIKLKTSTLKNLTVRYLYFSLFNWLTKTVGNATAYLSVRF